VCTGSLLRSAPPRSRVSWSPTGCSRQPAAASRCGARPALPLRSGTPLSCTCGSTAARSSQTSRGSGVPSRAATPSAAWRADDAATVELVDANAAAIQPWAAAGRAVGRGFACAPSLRGCSIQSVAGLKAHVCLPGSASPPACRGPASPPACRGRRLHDADRQPLTPHLPGRPPCAAEPARRAHSCQVAPLVGQKTRHLPTATRPRPDRLDNPNRPVSILSNSKPALCALAPVPHHEAAPVPVPSPGFAHPCRRARVAAATPKPARQARRLAVFPTTNPQRGEPPPPNAFRHFSCSHALLPTGSTASQLYLERAKPAGLPAGVVALRRSARTSPAASETLDG